MTGCKLQVSFCGFARFSLLRNDLTKAWGGQLDALLHGKQMANSLSHWICCAFPSSNKICPTLEALPAAEMSAQAFRKVGDRRGRAQIAAVLAETQ